MVKWRCSQSPLFAGLRRQWTYLHRTFAQSALDLHPTGPRKAPSMKASQKESLLLARSLQQDFGLLDGKPKLVTL